jgi:hypothetical protein
MCIIKNNLLILFREIIGFYAEKLMKYIEYIHSFCSQSYDRSVASSEASSPQGGV